MSQTIYDDMRRHILYPAHKDDDFGWFYHENEFFSLLTPEVALTFLNEQTEELTIQGKSGDIPVFKGCLERLAYGIKDPSHSDCYSIIARNERSWNVYPSCEWVTDSELLLAIRQNGLRPLSQRAVQQIVDRAAPSSIYENPFSGFDNPDKKYAPQEWLVEDMFPARSLNAIVGVSDSFKSFLAIHLACCIATGTSFFGKQVQQGPILFLAPEGGEGVPKRREAWKIEHGWQDCYVPFFTRSASFSFSIEDDLQFLRSKLSNASRFAPKAVFFDTLGQSLGSFDENSAKDINRIARYLNDLKSEFNCSFFWVDHAGHEAKRSRGSSAKFGALDTEFFVNRSGNELKVQNTKMKDADRCVTLYLQSEQQHGSLILKKIEQPQTHTETLLRIVSQTTDPSLRSIRRTFYDSCKAQTPQSKQKAFKRAVDALQKDGKISKKQTQAGAKLVLTTENGHTHPPL